MAAKKARIKVTIPKVLKLTPTERGTLKKEFKTDVVQVLKDRPVKPQPVFVEIAPPPGGKKRRKRTSSSKKR